jgi:hypothetical protein
MLPMWVASASSGAARPEAGAAGAVVAVARVNGLLGAGRALTDEQVAHDLDVTLGALAVTERELARAQPRALCDPRARGLEARPAPGPQLPGAWSPRNSYIR